MHYPNYRQRPRIIIIGAGFGGLQAAASLGNAPAEVLLLNRENYHTFVPLIYQVATAQIEPSLVAYPVRTLMRGFKNVRFLQATVERVDLQNKIIGTDWGTIAYDYLVLATGTQTRYHGIAGAQEHAFPLKTLKDAIALRQHILRCFEQAQLTLDPQRRRQLLSFVVVGGGATGVETAGALAELLRTAFRKDFPDLAEQARVRLVQSSAGLLPGLPQRLGNYSHRQLQRLGVTVQLNARVQSMDANQVTLPQGAIPAATVIWTAGTEPTRPQLSHQVRCDRKQQLKVQPTLQLGDWPNVYAIGDLAAPPQPLSGVAPEALQQGVTVARNLRRQLQGSLPKPFRYLNKGRLAIVGGYGGVGLIAGVPLQGLIPWLLWLVVHWIYLPGYRSRLLLLLTWLQNYLLKDRAQRHIWP